MFFMDLLVTNNLAGRIQEEFCVYVCGGVRGCRFNHITVLTLCIRPDRPEQTVQIRPRRPLATFTDSKMDLLKRSIRKTVPNLSNLFFLMKIKF